MKKVAIIQARMLSSRFRGKSLIAINGKSLLVRVLDRIKAMAFIDQIIVATTSDAADDPIAAQVSLLGVDIFRGHRADVLDRYVAAAQGLADEDLILRFTADNPFYDPARTQRTLEEHVTAGADYTHIDGLSHMVPEFIQVGALRRCAAMATQMYDREHVTPLIRKNPEHFQVLTLPADFAGLRSDLDQHFTIDEYKDMELIEKMLADIEPTGDLVSLDDCYLWMDRKNIGLDPAITRRGKQRMSIAGHRVGDGCPCFIVAEIGQNHNGDIRIAKKLIDMAARCNANAVKFQKRDIASELTDEAYNRPYDNPNSFGETYGKHREFLELSEAQHRELKDYAMSRGLVYFCTACDEPSVELMERIGNPVYKVASRDLTNIPLLQRIAKTGKPVILSTGMAGEEEIKDALEALGTGPQSILITHCVSQYPTEIDNVNLLAMQTMREKFGHLVGLSDHTTGIITCVAAAVLGACFIEKHITLSRAMKGTDHAGALEEEGLRRMIEYIRVCERALGSAAKNFNPAVQQEKIKLARSLTSRVRIPAGMALTDELLTMKSPGNGLAWKQRVLIVGKNAKADIPANTQLCVDHFGE